MQVLSQVINRFALHFRNLLFLYKTGIYDFVIKSDFVYFIADPSDDVAESAFSAWTSALEDARGHRRVRAIIEAAQILQGGKWQGQTPPPMPAPGMVPVAPAVVQPVQTVVQPATVPVTQPATVPVTQPVVY